MVLTDPLTGLYNRRFLEQHLAIEIERSRRQHYQLSVLMLDLNKFKQINHRYGHTAGDLALKQFAGHLKKAIRSSDLPVRMEGDKFLVLFPECSPEYVPHGFVPVEQAASRVAQTDDCNLFFCWLDRMPT